MKDGEEAEGEAASKARRVLKEVCRFEGGGWCACSKAATKNTNAISGQRRKVKAY